MESVIFLFAAEKKIYFRYIFLHINNERLSDFVSLDNSTWED